MSNHETPFDDTVPTPAQRSSRRTRRRGRGALIVVSSIVAVGGVALAITAALAPHLVEEAYGAVRVGGIAVAQDIGEAVGAEPTLRLGAIGGAELGRCDGTFTQMLSYQHGDDEDRILPVWAAHNGCGGDVILPLEVGDSIVVEDAYGEAAGDGMPPGEYRVVDSRVTSKVWTPVSELRDMEGVMLVQTCHYGRPTMIFLGLAPVNPAAPGEVEEG